MARQVVSPAGPRGVPILQEERILQAWIGLVPEERADLADALVDLVGDLLQLMHESLTGARADTESDTRHLAYRVAQQVLDEYDYPVLIEDLRDSLQEATLAYTTVADSSRAQRLLAFFNTVTDAYWQAYTDRLRKTMRRRAEEERAREDLAEEVRNELRVAKRVQRRLLPKVIPRIPGWDIAGQLVPARDVGGDYWSVKLYPDDGVITCKLADVTGHGIGAAILVAAVKFISGGFYRGAPSAAWVMERTNHVLVVETPSDIMVTMVYGWIRPATGHITLVNAGHGPVFTCRNGRTEAIAPTGPALGLLESRYSEVALDFGPGDLLFFCSDGIIEAHRRGAGKSREMFGMARLHEVVSANADLPSTEIADKVIQHAIDFAGAPTDDMSLMVIKRVEA